MPRVCTVCVHPERYEIEGMLVNRSAPYRIIAGQYSLTQAAVGRHVRSGHIAELLAKGHEAELDRLIERRAREAQAANREAVGQLLDAASLARRGGEGRA